MNDFSGADLFEKGTNMRRMASYFDGSERTPPHLLYARGTKDMLGKGSCHTFPLSLHCWKQDIKCLAIKQVLLVVQ